MLEFTLLAWDSDNYNIINSALTGISIASFEPVEPILEAGIAIIEAIHGPKRRAILRPNGSYLKVTVPVLGTVAETIRFSKSQV